MKKYLFIFLFLLIATTSYSADTKISAMTDITSPVVGDDLAIVDDPDGTPLSRKINVGALLDVMSGDVSSSTGVTVVADDSHSHVIANIDTMTSSALAGQISDETGTGLACFATSPTFTTSIVMGSADLNEAELEILDGATPTTTEFNLLSGLTVLSGSNTGDNTVATSGDSATAFFSSGTIEHEYGGLEADVNAYDGLIGITGGATYNQTGTTTQIVIFDGAGAPTSAALSGDATMTNGGVVTLSDVVESIYWPAGAISSDGTNCADPVQAVINSGPEVYTIICTDNDASQIEGHVVMPDSWDAGTITFELEYLQTAADTNVLNADVSVQARGAGETVNNTFGTEVAIDDAAVTGSNAVDHTTSAAVTANCTTSCVAGDTLFWRIELDATGTTTDMTTLHIIGVKMEYTSNVGD